MTSSKSSTPKQRKDVRKSKNDSKRISKQQGPGVSIKSLSYMVELHTMFTIEQKPVMLNLLITNKDPNELKLKLISDPCWRTMLARRISGYCCLRACDALAGPEAGVYIILGDVGSRLHKKLVLIRKAKKLSEADAKYDYYNGRGGLKTPKNLRPGERVVLVDDDLMTGQTLGAAIAIVEDAGGIITGVAAAIEWPEFEGRRFLHHRGYSVFSAQKAFSSSRQAARWCKKFGSI